jgi:putative intracellular protease/amidase
VRVLIPLPDRDFDVTEVAVTWRILRDAGHEVVFATDDTAAFVVPDDNYVSARWPGDAYLFGRRFTDLLQRAS